MKTTLPLLTAAALALPSLVRAQWVTQTCHLKAGWNVVYLHVDPSHTDINSLVQLSDPIEEIWLWHPDQTTSSPPEPTGSQWSSWNKNTGPTSVLQTLRANSAMLVRVRNGVSSFAWNVKGRPVAPVYRWTLTGLNFIGFPTAIPAPDFDELLAVDAQPVDWSTGGEIYTYPGGRGAATPVLLQPNGYRTTPVERDEAYWVRLTDSDGPFYNEYFGPFQVTGSGSAGIRFGDSFGQARLYLKNMSSEELTVTLRQVTSEAPPPGETAIAGPLPLLVRGPIDPTDLTFGYTPLTTGAYDWTLAPKGKVGSEVEVVLGINRAAMTGPPGALFAGTLRFTDSLGLARVEIGASAIQPSRDGLWVGSASVEYVSQYLKPYVKIESLDAFTGFDLDLVSVDDLSGIPDAGKGRVVVARIVKDESDTLHFRVFARDGQAVVDRGEADFPSDKSNEIQALRGLLASLWEDETLSQVQQAEVLHAVTPIIGQNELDAVLARLGLEQRVNGYRYDWDPASGRVLVFGQDRKGSYLVDGPILVDEGGVARPFPLRLIVHHGTDAAGADVSQLLQRAYIGLGASSNLVVATTESALLPSALDSARRVSAVHLPASDVAGPWTFTGAMEQGSTLSTTIILRHDDPTNPFVHAYHPDHDNLNAQFDGDLHAGVESFKVRRVISLQFAEPLDDFDSLTRSGLNLGGSYAETVTFEDENNDLKQFSVRGTFNLARINDIATLTANH